MAEENFGSNPKASQQALENSGLHIVGHVREESRPMSDGFWMTSTQWRHSAAGQRYLRGGPVWMRGDPCLNG
jgi:hypothetical protein